LEEVGPRKKSILVDVSRGGGECEEQGLVNKISMGRGETRGVVEKGEAQFLSGKWR